MEKILKVKDLKVHFPVKGGVFKATKGFVYAVDGVSFDVYTGETLGIVGETGCGKTTLGRTIVSLYRPTEGEIIFKDKNLNKLNKRDLLELRKDFQMIFQDPFESLNSRHTVRYIIEEPFAIRAIGDSKWRKNKVLDLLDKVGLSRNVLDKFPHEFSGGQRQRIGIARAIALNPALIVCDEPVSALDVSIQSQILNLLMDLQKEFSITYIFISHDLTVVRHVSDRVAVMYLGRLVEIADADSIYSNPLHPYTMSLISAIPKVWGKAQEKRIILQGNIPSAVFRPSGCFFHPRCPYATDLCQREYPELKNYGDENNIHMAACHYAKNDL
ncbi:MAG TPA: ATP-binding cassette domain-containing protein [Spirochaetota bacterium]|jgi:oligopeptide/dipeptide ABC transporter ATP-binding protein|nr:ATP-binding cassette domain-containing protein [Spirochaetota bacterium]HOK01048.1 ATP-binding cassette domain-containing protein [Spirochaetota bacterium]HOV08114.1 ATP-binding cassette domain-containing protein [Spirochaetota bacterium]HPP94027.1 ATP-binding cassette domain-containing protein [Spirochaetota bacterium]HRU64345.1 ATP-binding cassette domain-containing protein [Spirochaetota bacterium]